MNAPALETHNLSVSYRGRPVLQSVDLAIRPGSLTGLMGPNGAGKSTLLKTLIGEIRPDSGWSKLLGEPLAGVLGRVGYVPQRETIDWDFPVSVLDVALMGTAHGLGWFGRPGRSHRRRALEALEQTGMAEFASRRIGELSGGQQQRAFLARALAQDAEIYLMDEPFAGVDAATERAIIALLGGMRDAGKTVVVVHHDLRTAVRYFDDLVLLNLRVVAHGRADEVMRQDILEKAYGGKLTLLSEIAAREARGGEGREP
ncbi:MAG: metal ABC transporter ATP-binding protein [Luteolibacter sp.]|jgi:manganese/zinc/iron transport system ATP- binding protein